MHFGVNSKKMFGWGDIEVSSVFKRFEQLYNEEHGFTSRELLDMRCLVGLLSEFHHYP